MLLIFMFDSPLGRDKFERLYYQYKNLLFHKAYEILRDPMLAEDAVSEALIRIHRNLQKIDEPFNNRSVSFVVTIVKNAALTILSQRRSDIVPFEELEVADSADWEADVLSALSADRIYGLVDALGDELKSVFLLKFAYDMSHREIAQTLGITENNATVRLHRAKKKLAAMLEKEGVRHEKSE